jgi:hypothetical protein
MGPDETKDASADVPILSEEQPKHGLNFLAPAKEKKTAHELSVMILQDVMKMDGCPQSGVSVTVYGLNPWNSLLTFGVDAGPVRNKVELQGYHDIITDRLKRLYHVRD